MREQHAPPGAADWKAPQPSPTNSEAIMQKIQREKEDAERKLFDLGWEQIYEPKFDSKGRATIPDKARTWNRVNDVINAVRSDGTKYARPYEAGVMKELQKLGFQKDESMTVVYANVPPKHPEALKRWQKLWDEAGEREHAEQQ